MGGAPGIGSALAVGKRWDSRSRACCLNRRYAGSIRHRARRLADLRTPRLIADTQVSPRRSTMEDTAHRAVCQTKDFTILRPLQGSFVSMESSCLCPNVDQCPGLKARIPRQPWLAGEQLCRQRLEPSVEQVKPRRTRRRIGQVIKRTLHQASLDPCRPGNGRGVRDRLDRELR